jgi:hypothetical protein
VNGVGHEAMAIDITGPRQLTRFETCGHCVERVARGDLRKTSLVRVHSRARLPRRARRNPLGFEHREPRLVDRLEWQPELKTCDRCRIELAGALQGSFEIELRPVTLETESPHPRDRGVTRRRSLELVAASRTEHLRAFAFELAARESNPLIINDLRDFFI